MIIIVIPVIINFVGVAVALPSLVERGYRGGSATAAPT
jgi:hypothetical protein